MRISKVLIAYSVAAVLAGGTAFAQQQQSSSQQQSDPQQQSGSQQLQSAQQQQFYLSNQMVGKSTQTANGQDLGKIKDIAFNQQGEVFALVDVGNSRWAAVPWQLVNPTSAKGNQNLVLNTTQQALKSAPAVTKDAWGQLDNPTFTQGIYAYYHVQAPQATGGAQSPGGSSQGQSDQQNQGQGTQQK